MLRISRILSKSSRMFFGKSLKQYAIFDLDHRVPKGPLFSRSASTCLASFLKQALKICSKMASRKAAPINATPGSFCPCISSINWRDSSARSSGVFGAFDLDFFLPIGVIAFCLGGSSAVGWVEIPLQVISFYAHYSRASLLFYFDPGLSRGIVLNAPGVIVGSNKTNRWVGTHPTFLSRDSLTAAE